MNKHEYTRRFGEPPEDDTVIKAKATNDSKPVDKLIILYTKEIDELQTEVRMPEAHYNVSYRKYIQGKITELSRVVTDLKGLREMFDELAEITWCKDKINDNDSKPLELVGLVNIVRCHVNTLTISRKTKDEILSDLNKIEKGLRDL